MLNKEILFREYMRRHRLKSGAFSLRSPDFIKQNHYLDSREFRFRSVCCTRRAGKSTAEVKDHVELCLKYPGSRTVYLGLTLDSVSEICWDLFKEENEKNSLGLKFNETKKIVFFPNGSRIRLFGVDASDREMRKILGQKLRKVTIDEAGSMTIDMVKLCYQMIMPALTDLAPESWLSIIGTPENIPNTFFENVDSGLERGTDWKVFRWTAYDNPFMAKQWEREIERLKLNNPKVVDTSWFKTHYLGQWCTDDNLLILNISKAQYQNAKKTNKSIYILGVDLGFNDSTSFNILHYNPDENFCTLIYSKKKQECDITDTANEIKRLDKKYRFSHLIVDGANKQGVEEMKRRHSLPLKPAEKQDKATFLRILNDDIKQARIRFTEDREQIEDFLSEAKHLIWEDEDKDKEDPRCQNHCTDGTLYAWRYCYSYLFKEEEKPPSRNSEAYLIAQEEKEAREIMEQKREQEEFLNELDEFI